MIENSPIDIHSVVPNQQIEQLNAGIDARVNEMVIALSGVTHQTRIGISQQSQEAVVQQRRIADTKVEAYFD